MRRGFFCACVERWSVAAPTIYNQSRVSLPRKKTSLPAQQPRLTAAQTMALTHRCTKNGPHLTVAQKISPPHVRGGDTHFIRYF